MQIGATGFLIFFLVFLIWFWNSVYVIKEWERAVILRLGRMLDRKSTRLNSSHW